MNSGYTRGLATVVLAALPVVGPAGSAAAVQRAADEVLPDANGYAFAKCEDGTDTKLWFGVHIKFKGTGLGANRHWIDWVQVQAPDDGGEDTYEDPFAKVAKIAVRHYDQSEDEAIRTLWSERRAQADGDVMFDTTVAGVDEIRVRVDWTRFHGHQSESLTCTITWPPPEDD